MKVVMHVCTVIHNVYSCTRMWLLEVYMYNVYMSLKTNTDTYVYIQMYICTHTQIHTHVMHRVTTQ